MAGMPVPVFRLQLESMRLTLMTAIMEHHDEVERYVADELKRFIAEYDFAKTVREQLTPVFEDAIRESLTSYFRYGKGRAALSQAIEAAIAGGGTAPE